MTPTFKLRRPQLLAMYVRQLKALYAKHGEPPASGEKWPGEDTVIDAPKAADAPKVADAPKAETKVAAPATEAAATVTPTAPLSTPTTTAAAPAPAAPAAAPAAAS